jgi:hypothetical protein
MLHGRRRVGRVGGRLRAVGRGGRTVRKRVDRERERRLERVRLGVEDPCDKYQYADPSRNKRAYTRRARCATGRRR